MEVIGIAHIAGGRLVLAIAKSKSYAKNLPSKFNGKTKPVPNDRTLKTNGTPHCVSDQQHAAK